MRLAGRRVVLGVTGGIAAYKSCTVVRRLRDLGATVDVVLTEGAAQFVGSVTFEALSGRPVLTSLWEATRALDHVRLGQETDLILVVPATAHLIARMAHGLADDLLTTMLLARTGPVALAPAMNDAMYAAVATQTNIQLLQDRGVHLIGPSIGSLAEGPSDRPGRMSEPEAIVAHAERLIRSTTAWRGLRVVVTAGPTRESLDPVRVLTNRSSGKMGFRLAEAAWARGAEVVLLAGPSGEVDPEGCSVLRVESTKALHAAVESHLPTTDILVMAAAPADFRPVNSDAEKRPREQGDRIVNLEPTEDILLATRELRKPGMTTVGFALETGDAVEKGRAKLARKDLDMIVVNDALEPGAGFEVDTNRVVIIRADQPDIALPCATKRTVAEQILDAVERRRG